MKTFLESTEKTAVFTYGRNNPPTVGHEKLFNKTIEVAKKHKSVAYIYTSHSQDAKKNPLTAEYKVELIKHAYPEAHVASSSKEMPSMLHVAKHLYQQGHKHLVMVAGSDRVDELNQRLHLYNGEHSGAMYNYKSIKVVSAGQRDPDAEGASGMSGTKLRGHAIAGEKDKFKSGLMSGLSDEHKEKVYHAVRKALKVQEIYDPHLKISKYQWGEKEGTDHMKSMTPGEKPDYRLKKLKEAFQKIPYLLMSPNQKHQLHEQNMTLNFDGIQTRSMDMCADAYKLFKQHIEDLRAGKHIGEITGHEPDKTISPTSDTQRQVAAGIAIKPPTMRAMQFKQYTGL